jgi:hypothetical protein
MAETLFDVPPDLISKADVPVMLARGQDDQASITRLWAWFEDLVGLRGRKMYATADAAGTYTTCTPVKDGDDPAALGLETGVLAGGWYLRGRLSGEPPGLYARILPAMAELEAAGHPADRSRPAVEFYRRYDQLELWLPVTRA